ncbi:thrombospondin type 3 repeat-containing protein [Candidatus Peregrinibacteria bacterium]|nr:thrombospondin type 3 repeat-containing protein [Candidatus Peregrinibacteria bacterium]
MKNIILKTSILASLLFSPLFFSQTAFADYTGDISINSKDIRFSTDEFLEGKSIRIYATTENPSNKDLLGAVRFFDNGNQIKGDQAISIFRHKTDDVFIDWTPSIEGNHKISVKLYPWEPEIDDPSNNWIVSDIYVVKDTDRDGIPDSRDPDIDGDGVPNEKDAFPLEPKESVDTDHDGIGDNADTDDDNDGIPDTLDAFPLDPNESVDTDKDGIGDNKDTDDDNDGIPDLQEIQQGTDPLQADTDGDKANDKQDAFPLNPKEWVDTDHDGIGNNADPDDDNDGLTDAQDPFPLNKAPVVKLKNENTKINLLSENTFDASPSRDDDGEITSYTWQIDNGGKMEGNSINYIFSTLGKHMVRLTVKDNSGEFSSKDFEITVLNTQLYQELAATLLSILLATLIFLKYIKPREKSQNINNENSDTSQIQ